MSTPPPPPQWSVMQGDCLRLLHGLPAGSVDLVVTSPPYGITTAYADKSPLDAYLGWLEPIIRELYRVLRSTGVVCFEVGTWTDEGEVFPLDCVLYPLFKRLGFQMRNRVVWHIPHGAPIASRLAGRHETVMVWSKSAEYTFRLDDVRVPQKYPNKKATRGPNKGRVSSNAAGKSPEDVWLDLVAQELDSEVVTGVSNVKHGHSEKTTVHPCIMPVQLCERCVLAWSAPGAVVLDPFAGVGSTLIAAVRHGRVALGMELRNVYCEEARRRVSAYLDGNLRIVPLVGSAPHAVA